MRIGSRQDKIFWWFPLPHFILSFILSPRSVPIMERCCHGCSPAISCHLCGIPETWPAERDGKSCRDLVPKTDRSLVWALEQMEVLPEGQRPFKYYMDGKMERELSDNSS